MDEYIRALRVSLTGEEFTFEGTGYVAYGNRIIPGPVQQQVPIYCGGNAKRAIRRVVDLCDGWNPFFTGVSGVSTATTRTVAMSDESDLEVGLTYMREYCEQVGREDFPEIVLGGLTAPGVKVSSQEMLDLIGKYSAMGVSTAAISANGRTRAEYCDDVERIGAEVIAKIDK
jgi:hypothetical protein